MNTFINGWLHWLEPMTSWHAFVFLLGAFLLCAAVFRHRAALLNGATTPDGQMLKLSFDDLFAIIARMTPADRKLYAYTECTLDVAFPIIYSHLLAIAMLLGFGAGGMAVRVFATLPLVAAGCDLVENYSVAWLVSHHQTGTKSKLGWVTLAFGKTKYVLVMTSLGLSLLSLLWCLIRLVCR